MRTRVKVCCLNSYEEAICAIENGADAVGFVGVSPPSPRTIPDTKIAEIVSRIPPPVATFLLSSKNTSEEVFKQLRVTGASTVQLSAPDIEAKEAGLLRKRSPGTRLVKVVHVEDGGELKLIRHYEPYVHAFLLDSGSAKRPMPEYGGTGRVHDWSISAEFVRQSPHPVFLAGGLNSENVIQAIKVVRPFGVDLCHGVRTEGRLDRNKLRKFIEAVRTADAELDRL